MEKVYNIIRERLYSSNNDLINYTSEKKNLLDVIQRTSSKGESNSILVIGRRGCGKTQLVSSVLKEIDANKGLRENILRVHLNGLLQTDERASLKEMTRQLNLETAAGDRVFASTAENLRFLLEVLRSGDRSNKSILFVLEEFDLFARHRNQSLLYNLFDVAQSDYTPICVLGVTCRLDVVEMLEKRVKSRFSHRQIHLSGATAASFKDYQDAFGTYLLVPTGAGCDGGKTAKRWNRCVAELLESAVVSDCLRRSYAFSTSLRNLKLLLILPVSQLCAEKPFIEPSDLVDSLSFLRHDAKSNLLKGLSLLELSLVIAMVKRDDRHEGEPLTFEMVYDEYLKHSRNRGSAQTADKPVVMKAFDQLVGLELVSHLPSGGGGSGQLLPGYRVFYCLVNQSQILATLDSYPNCPTDLKQWAQARHNYT